MSTSTGSSKGNKRILRLIIVLIVIAGFGYGAYRVYEGIKGGTKADDAIETLKSVIPGLGEDTDVATGLGRDPLAAISIDGTDVVGVIEIPAIEIMAPVAGKGIEEEFFASWKDGSPVKGSFEIIGGRDDVFRNISSLQPGDKVVFTDIDGIRYSYTVTTQYHLKKWDDGDNDLLLCYETDDKTFFVVGCTSVK